MKNMFKSVFTPDSEEAIFSKSPMIAGIILIYLATIFVRSSGRLAVHEVAGFTIVIIIQLGICLISGSIFKNKYWLYFVIQGIITFNYAVISPNGYDIILLGLIPLFVIQSMIIYTDGIKVIVTSIFFYSIFCGTIIKVSGVEKLIDSISVLIIITIAMRVYSIIFFKQVKLRIQTQKIYQELSLAYEKVEELTLINERQRMARDLHDTLSQGLAGVIMQLEAVDANISKNNINRAHEIVHKCMEHARKTLADSRLVIHDLRTQTRDGIDFAQSVDNEVSAFKNVSSTSISTDIKIASQLPIKISKHILYIVREGLNNISKHSQAEKAAIEIIENSRNINITIKDDGIGFEVKHLDKLFGHYGLLGMTERVKAVNGKIKIKSKRKQGTEINIIIPIERGIDEENG